MVFHVCDGGLLQGYTKQPVKVKNEEGKEEEIYFRGSAIYRANFKWIDKIFDLNAAEKIVFAGSSFGSIGVFNWMDYLKSMVKNPEKIYGILDTVLYPSPQLATFIVE